MHEVMRVNLVRVIKQVREKLSGPLKFRRVRRSVDEVESRQSPLEPAVTAKVARIGEEVVLAGVTVRESHHRRKREGIVGAWQEDGKAVDEMSSRRA